MDNDTSLMIPIQTSTETGGMPPLNESIDLNNAPLATPPPAPLESSGPGDIQMLKIDIAPYDSELEFVSPLTSDSSDGSISRPDSPLNFESFELSSHLSTCNMMNDSEFAEKVATLCQATKMLKNCAEGHCAMCGDELTCVCGHCKNGSDVKGNANNGNSK